MKNEGAKKCEKSQLTAFDIEVLKLANEKHQIEMELAKQQLQNAQKEGEKVDLEIKILLLKKQEIVKGQ